MRDKKRFLSVMLLTTAMLLAGGCGNQTQSVSARAAETAKEAGTGESAEQTPDEPEESMESPQEEDDSEKEADTTQESGEQASEYEIISLEDTVMYATADCDIMSGAGAEYDTVGSLSYAQEVTVNGKVEAGEDEIWYVIQTEDDSTQMVNASLLSETKPTAQTASGSGSSSGSNSGGGTGSTGGTGNSQTASNTTETTPTTPAETTPEQPTTEQTTESTQPTHVHEWKAHEVTTQVWVPNVVTVEDYETQRVCIGSINRCNCGFETTDHNTIIEHGIAHALAGEQSNYQEICQYEDQQVLVGTHEEDHGHYETSTYIDYYYCEGCGAIQ